VSHWSVEVILESRIKNIRLLRDLSFMEILTTINFNLFPNWYTIRITPLSARVFVLTVNTFDIFVTSYTWKQLRTCRVQAGSPDEYSLVMYLTQELWRCKMRTGNASSAAVALFTELQECALHHAVCWIIQSPNASSVPSLTDDNHEKTPRSKWLYSVLAVSLLNYDPTQHSYIYDKF
jgi:hypothetical protein